MREGRKKGSEDRNENWQQCAVCQSTGQGVAQWKKKTGSSNSISTSWCQKYGGTTRPGSITNWNPLNYIERVPQRVWRGGWGRFALLGDSNWFHCAWQDQSIPIKIIESSSSSSNSTLGWKTPTSTPRTTMCVLQPAKVGHILASSNQPQYKTNPKFGVITESLRQAVKSDFHLRLSFGSFTEVKFDQILAVCSEK